MINIRLHVSSNQRLEEYAKYIARGDNLGVTSEDIEKHTKKAAKKAFGTTASRGLPNNKSSILPSEALLSSLNDLIGRQEPITQRRVIH